MISEAEVGLDEETRVPEYEAVHEYDREVETRVEGLRMPNHVESDSEDAQEEEQEWYYKDDQDHDTMTKDCFKIELHRVKVSERVAVIDGLDDQNRKHEGEGDADLIGDELDHTLPRILL